MRRLTSLALFSGLFLACWGCGESEESSTPQGTDGAQGTAAPAPGGAASQTPAESQASPAGQGFETPEAAFTAFRDALQNDDWATAAGYMTDESQAAFAGVLIFGAGIAAAFDPEHAKDLEALMEKHGLSEESTSEPPPGVDPSDPLGMMRALSAPIKDKAAFIGELTAWLDKNADSSDTPDFGAAELTDVTVEGETARGTVTGGEGPDSIEFRRINGRWFVHLPDEEFQMAGGPDTTMEFGPSGGLGEFDEFDFGFDESDPLPPIGAVTVDEFNTAWKTSLDVSDSPAIDEIRKLAQACELEIEEVPQLAEKLQQPVSLQLADVSRLEAIERICEQVGVHPRFRLHKMTFGDGPRPVPATTAGPFLIQVKKVGQNAPYPTGQVELQFAAAGLPVSAIASLADMTISPDIEDSDTLTLRLSEIAGTGGQEIHDDEFVGGMGATASKSLFLFDHPVNLKNLVRSVTEVERIAGALSFELPTGVETLRFDSLEPDTTVTAGGITLTLKDASGNVEVEYKGTESDRISLTPLGADGEPLPVSGSSSFGFGDEGSVSVFVEGEPASLEARVVTATQRVTLPFEIAGIPLLLADQMPEIIEPLTFDGDVPLSIEFVRIEGEGDDRKVVYNFSNRSNKDLQMVNLQQYYLDADGNVLDDFPYSHSGFGTMPSAGETQEQTVSAFFMPEETKAVRAELQSARFVDASRWEKEE